METEVQPILPVHTHLSAMGRDSIVSGELLLMKDRNTKEKTPTLQIPKITTTTSQHSDNNNNSPRRLSPRSAKPLQRRGSVTALISCSPESSPGLSSSPASSSASLDLSSSPDKTHEPISIEVVGSFWNQIAGHRMVLKAKHGKICKPLLPRELWFYQSLNQHPAYKAFTAHWYGCIALTPQQLMTLVKAEMEDTNINENNNVECNINGNELTKESNSNSNSNRQLEKEKEEEKEHEHERNKANEEAAKKVGITITVDDDNADDNEEDEETLKKQKIEVTTWSKTLEGRLLLKLEKEAEKSGSGASNKFNYLVLQDITYGYEHPCCLDVKVGTRAYGDNATHEKRLGQIRKVASTTSGSLGIRLMGIKVWQPHLQQYIEIDKYRGREMDAKEFEDSLALYFRHGPTGQIRRTLIGKFISKVEELLRMFEKEHVYRMYSTSLLFVYEGAQAAEISTKNEKNFDEKENENEKEGETCSSFSSSKLTKKRKRKRN
jgi:inositol-hexakisphosphate kinase